MLLSRYVTFNLQKFSPFFFLSSPAPRAWHCPPTASPEELSLHLGVWLCLSLCLEDGGSSSAGQALQRSDPRPGQRLQRLIELQGETVEVALFNAHGAHYTQHILLSAT